MKLILSFISNLLLMKAAMAQIFSISPNSWNPSQSGQTQTFTINSPENLPVSSLTSSPPDWLQITGQTCSGTNPASSCTYSFTIKNLPSSSQSYSFGVCTSNFGSSQCTGSLATITFSPVINNKISASVSELVLSVKNKTEFGLKDQNGNTLQSGLARTITVTNKGETAVTHLNASMNTPPSGTSLTGCSNQTLEPNASCTMTITPGTSSSSGCSSGTAPQPSVIQVNWDNSGSPLSIPVTVLDYGCLFQGGYVFALDDSPPANASIQGKVVAQNDQPSTMPWNPNNVLFCGISDNSTPTSPYPTGANCTPAPSKTTPYCLGKNDGSCNTKIIQAAVTSPTPTPTALVCSQSKDGGFTDWYLPAICELSYALQGAGFDNICGSKLTPSTQNIYYLFHANLANLQAMPYWSSTQYQGDNSATWWANFGATVTPGPGIFFRQRSSSNGLVRCVRQFSLSP